VGSGDTSLGQGITLAEPVKLGKKRGVLGSCAQSSGLSVGEKTSLEKVHDRSPVGVVIGKRKRPTIYDVGPHALSLLASSSSEEDASLREPCRKRVRESPPLEASLWSSGSTKARGKCWLNTCLVLYVAGLTLYFLAQPLWSRRNLSLMKLA
jgi:hypothetical protein